MYCGTLGEHACRNLGLSHPPRPFFGHNFVIIIKRRSILRTSAYNAYRVRSVIHRKKKQNLDDGGVKTNLKARRNNT